MENISRSRKEAVIFAGKNGNVLLINETARRMFELDPARDWTGTSLIDLLVSIKEKKAVESLREFIKSQNVNPAVKEHAESRIKDFT